MPKMTGQQIIIRPGYATRNILLFNEASKIVSEFNNENIDYLVLKGLYLAFAIYPDASLRPMTDIDLLVKREDLDRIEEVLNRLEYTEESPKVQRSYGCDATFCSKDGIYLDIHWDLCQYERFKGVIDITPDFWSRAGEFSLDGLSLKTLSLEDHILYVSLHSVLIHLLDDLKGIYDLFYLMDNRVVDWKNIINNADKYGIKISLYYSLFKSSKVTGLKIPDFVLTRLKPGAFKKAMLDYLLLKHRKTYLRYLCQALMTDNFLDTFRVLWRVLKAVPRAYNRDKPIIFRNMPAAIKT